MNKILIVLLALTTLASCSEYQKALKSEDPALKVEVAKNSSDSNSKTNLPTKVTNQVQNTTPKNAINKTIVIDAGHGGDDVGAVGPNKEYEKATWASEYYVKTINEMQKKYPANLLKADKLAWQSRVAENNLAESDTKNMCELLYRNRLYLP